MMNLFLDMFCDFYVKPFILRSGSDLPTELQVPEFHEHEEWYWVEPEIPDISRKIRIDELESTKVRLLENLSTCETKKHRNFQLFRIGILESNIYQHKKCLN